MSAVLFELRDAVARITLNRPDVANAVNLELARELMHAAIRCDEDPAVRAVVIAGAGRMFCAGGDIKGFAQVGDALPSHIKEVTTYLHAAISRFTRMDAPVVAAVHGSAAGAGMSLACACDFVVAAQSARFVMAYTRAGLAPDGSSTYFLPRIVGLKRAIDLTLTNRSLSADEAHELGIVTRVVADGDLAHEVDALGARLAAGPTRTFGSVKRLFHAGWTGTLETQMELETRAIADAARTDDAREGIRAFSEKRDPVFRGR